MKGVKNLNRVLTGKSWTLGDDISVESILPSKVLYKQDSLNTDECLKYVFEEFYDEWYKKVQKGDILVTGKNFAWGSSRPAPRVLSKAGVSCIISDSVNRLFFRNAIHIGLPVIFCDDVLNKVNNNDLLKVDIVTGKITNVTKDTEFYGIGFPIGTPPYEIIMNGGIIK